MSSINQTQISRIMKDIADLRKVDAKEAKKEADLFSKTSRASEAANRTKNNSTAQSKMREIVSANKALSGVQKKRADISSKIAVKSKNLHSYEEKHARDEEKNRKKIADEQKKLMREREVHERRITNELLSRKSIEKNIISQASTIEQFDFFISHASEDKDVFVRELAEALQAKGANVWYDEFTLKVGDSLRRNIDRGLGNSTYGVVVFSEHFFKKEWANKELDGLVNLEIQGQTRILPIWHKVSKDEVSRYSPTLADKVALNTSLKSIDEIATKLCSLIE